MIFKNYLHASPIKRPSIFLEKFISKKKIKSYINSKKFRINDRNSHFLFYLFSLFPLFLITFKNL